MRSHHVLAPLTVSLLFACGGGTPSSDATQAKADAKTAGKTSLELEAEQKAAERKAEREAKKKAEEDAKAKLAAEIDQIAVLPAKLAKSNKAACADVSKAYDQFMTKSFTGETLDKWNQAKNTQLGMTERNCNAANKLEVATCQATALSKAPPTLKDNVPDILARCMEKFGGGASAPQAAAGIPPKRK